MHRIIVNLPCIHRAGRKQDRIALGRLPYRRLALLKASQHLVLLSGDSGTAQTVAVSRSHFIRLLLLLWVLGVVVAVEDPDTLEV